MYSSTHKISLCCRIAFVIAAVSLSIACFLKVSTIRYEEERRIANAATDQFKGLFNDRKFEEIYQMTDERARATKSKTGLISLLSALRDDRGKMIQFDPVDSYVKPSAGYSEATLVFNTKFERSENKMAFVWYVSDGKAALFSITTE